MEKTPFVDQKAAARFERVRDQVLAHPLLFATQGTVVAGWRAYRGHRLGPYFRVSYRHSGRQRSIYLGRCQDLARRVRDLLARFQRPHRQRRLFARLKARVRASLRRVKVGLKRLLAPRGIHLKGFEFRGSRRALPRYMEAFREKGTGPICAKHRAPTEGWSGRSGKLDLSAFAPHGSPGGQTPAVLSRGGPRSTLRLAASRRRARWAESGVEARGSGARGQRH